MSNDFKSKKIVIYGKGSFLYNSIIKSSLNNSDKYKIVGELSHLDNLDTVDSEAICILFAYSKNPMINEQILLKLSSLFYRVLIVGSASVESKRASNFEYPYIKLLQLNSVKKNNIKNVLVANFGEFAPSCRKGKRKISVPEDLMDALGYLANGNFGISANFKIAGEINYHLTLYRAFERIIGIKLTAFLFKKFTRFTYGYNIVE